MDVPSLEIQILICNRALETISRWTLHGGTSSDVGASGDIVTSQAGPRANFLTIPSVSHSHRGIYTCTAVNNAGTVSYSTSLNVNGQLVQ